MEKEKVLSFGETLAEILTGMYMGLPLGLITHKKEGGSFAFLRNEEGGQNSQSDEGFCIATINRGILTEKNNGKIDITIFGATKDETKKIEALEENK